MSRIAVVKMNISPRLMFFFQTIPIVKETKQFDAWQKKIFFFQILFINAEKVNEVQARKKTRIKMKILCDKRGGLQFPNLKLYH